LKDVNGFALKVNRTALPKGANEAEFLADHSDGFKAWALVRPVHTYGNVPKPAAGVLLD
jgi:hypothetical protein